MTTQSSKTHRCQPCGGIAQQTSEGVVVVGPLALLPQSLQPAASLRGDEHRPVGCHPEETVTAGLPDHRIAGPTDGRRHRHIQDITPRHHTMPNLTAGKRR